MLRMVIPFGAGILFAGYFTLPAWFVLGAFAFTGALALLLRSSLYTLGALFLFGIAATHLQQTQQSVPADLPTAFQIVVRDRPADRGRYSSTEALVTAWRDPATGKWHASNDKLMLRADSTLTLQPGERIRCRGILRPLRTGPESYRRLMTRRGFAGTMWLSERNILDREDGHYGNLHLKAVERLTRMGAQGDPRAVCLAMAAGDKSALTPQLRAAYSRSGMAHLLAVSGLHVGIVFVLVNLALWWMPLLRRGHLMRNVLAAACIWAFAAAAGFPPSAVRAAVMFSLLQFALASASTYVAGNVLATAAFGMLLYNPDYLFDISFQLSFLAVAAILAWGLPLCRVFRTRHRAVNMLLDGITVSLVSSIATAPLVSHTFGVVPILGILISPAAIALAGVVVLGSTFWMIAPISALAPAFAWVVGGAARTLNLLAEKIAHLPFAAAEQTLSTGQTALIYLFFVLLTALAGCRDEKKSVHLPKR